MKNTPFIFLLISSFIVLCGCNGVKVGTSLLSDGKTCTSTSTEINCITSPSNSLGAIDIQPSATTISANMELTDTVEITGSCHDLGRKNNRILVQVFAGELDESVDPYIDNSTSDKCLDASSSGIPVGQKCFNVTTGLGLKEDVGLPDEKTFPQCHNGQFGFSVRLGKVLSSVALGTKYLVRFKLRTQEGSLNDTVWSRVSITRELSAPRIDEAVVDPVQVSCALSTSVARFNPYINYSLLRTYNLFNGGVSVAAPIPAFGATSASPAAFKFTNTQLVDGVTYNYSLVAAEGQFPYVTVPTAISNTISCAMPKLSMRLWKAPTSGTCYINVAQVNTVAVGLSYDIGYSTNPAWVDQNVIPTAGFCSSGSIESSDCAVSGLATGGQQYYISVRAKRGAVFATDEIGKWATAIPCKPL